MPRASGRPKSLTDLGIKQMNPPAKGQVDVYDPGFPGLALRFGSGGSKTWVHMRRVGGKLQRRRLGEFPAMGVAAAHEAWRASRDDVTAIQSGAQPMPAPSRDAIERVVADWLKRDQADNDSHDETKRVFERNVLTEWKGRLVTSISKRDCIELLDGIADDGKRGKAANLHRLMHRFFRWCAGRDIITVNPMANLDQPEIAARDRVLSDVEIVSFWKTCKVIGYPFGPVGQALLLTGARLREIGELRQDEIDAKCCCIRLGGVRVKNDQPRVIALTPLSWRVLHDGPRISGCPYVFSTTGKTPVSGWSKMKMMMDREMRFNSEWRIHDLRRTVRTRLSEKAMGVPYEVREAVIGHAKKGLDRVYDHHDYLEEQRDALAKWSARVLELVG